MQNTPSSLMHQSSVQTRGLRTEWIAIPASSTCTPKPQAVSSERVGQSKEGPRTQWQSWHCAEGQAKKGVAGHTCAMVRNLIFSALGSSGGP